MPCLYFLAFLLFRYTASRSAAAAQAHQQVQRVQAGPPAGQRHRQRGEEREHFCRSVRTHGHPPRFTEVGGEKPHQDIRQIQQNELFDVQLLFSSFQLLPLVPVHDGVFYQSLY